MAGQGVARFTTYFVNIAETAFEVNGSNSMYRNIYTRCKVYCIYRMYNHILHICNMYIYIHVSMGVHPMYLLSKVMFFFRVVPPKVKGGNIIRPHWFYESTSF